MKTTTEKAIDELVDHCPSVVAAWNNLQEAGSKAEQKALLRVYRQAKYHLKQLFKEAQREGVEPNALVRIIIERIPTQTLNDLSDLAE